MSSVAATVAALLSGAALALVAVFGGTAALTPEPEAKNAAVVNYDGS